MSILAPIAGIELASMPEYSPAIVHQMVFTYALTNEIHPHMIYHAASCNNIVMLGELVRRYQYNLTEVVYGMDPQQKQCMYFVLKYIDAYSHFGAPNFT